MKQILYISFFILLSCNASKPQIGQFIAVKDIIDNSNFFETYHYKPGMHTFQTDNIEIVYDQFNRKVALKNKRNNKIIRTTFTYLAFLNEKYLIAKEKSLTGIIDINGNVIIPIMYDDIELYNIDKPFFVIQKNKKLAIVDYSGKEMYPFNINFIKSAVTYKNKVFLTIDKDNYVTQTLKICNSKIEIVPNAVSFKQLKNNLATFCYLKNSMAFYGVYNMENDAFLDDYGKCYYHKQRNEIWAMSRKADYRSYDIVIDSSFTVKPNKYENITKIENDIFFIETKNGMQIMDVNENIAPFIYPKIESFNEETNQNSFIYGKDYSEYQNKLFKFYTSKDSKKYGIINFEGKIIVDAEKFDFVTYSDLNNMNSYNNNLPSFKQQYLRENKLDKLFYAGNYYSDKNGQIKIFRENSIELITIPIEKDEDCYLELSQFSIHGHLMAKCNDKMKIYDLNSKKIVLEIKESKGFENFKERYLNGYYYFSFDNPKQTKINYLSNKLKHLYEQEVSNDSVWYKIINGDKVYFNKNNKIGLIDFTEKEIVPAEYDKIDIVHQDFNIVGNNKKYGVILNNNKIVIGIVYDKIIYNISNQSFDCYIDDKKEMYYLNQIELNK